MNQPTIPTVSPQNAANTNATPNRQANAFKGDVAELAFWNFFQQLQTGSPARQPLQGGVAVTVATTEPGIDITTHKETTATTTTAVVGSDTSSSAVTKTDAKTDTPLQLNGALTNEDERFLEWLIHSANEPPVVLPNGLPLPAWVANSTFNQQRQSTFTGLTSQLSQDMVALVKQAYKTGRAIRVPLQNQTELILKIHQDKVSAEFIANNAAMANTLQQTVADLKRHLANKHHLPIGDIGYRDDEPKQKHPQEHHEPDEPA